MHFRTGGSLVTLAQYDLRFVSIVVIIAFSLLQIALLMSFTRVGVFALFVGAFVFVTAALSGAALLTIQLLYPQAVVVPRLSSLMWLVVPASLASVLLFDLLLEGLLLRVLKLGGVGLSAIWIAETVMGGLFAALSLVMVARLLTAVELAAGAALLAGFVSAFVRYYLGLWIGSVGLRGDAAADLGEVMDAEELS